MDKSYSDHLLDKAFEPGRTLTRSERQELREAYLYEEQEKERHVHRVQESVKQFKDELDPLNMPRHRTLHRFPYLTECPLCFKMKGIDLSRVKESLYFDHHPEDFCMKPHLHNDKTYHLLIRRPRIDLDGDTKGGKPSGQTSRIIL